MLLEEPIARVAQALGDFLSSADLDESFLTKPHEFSKNPQLSDVVDLPENENEETSDFDKAIEKQKTEFTVLAGLTRVADTLVLEIQDSEIQTHQNLLPESHIVAICKLCLLLEWQVNSIHAGTYPSSKADFFTLLQLVLESLFSISLSHISRFWDFLELRIGLFKSKVFDKNVTLHRIALLGLCNGLTDKYYVRNSFGKLDSYAKDTFNDEFQARVRMFLANMLSFDDLTGLNKYFAIANRESKEPIIGKSKLSDDDLLRDLVAFCRLLRNPFGYFKSPRQLQALASSIDKLAVYLLEQEAKYAKKHPGRDLYSVEPEQLEEEIAEATEKLKKTVFVPENYWLSLFDAQRDEAIETEDRETVLKQLDSLAFRRLLLVHIYLVATFFVELLASNKRELLRSTGGTVKHISDETTPESSARIFLNIKRDIPRQSRAWETQLSFLLLTLSQSEEHWWSWLLYGKDKDGQPLLADKTLTDEELSATKEKLTSAFPFKTKRYFNTHATPQLSRKMKTQTGLHLLEKDGTDSTDYTKLIDSLTTQIDEAKQAGDTEREKELFEERTVLHWKRLKEARLNLWLQLGDLLKTEDIELKKDPKTEDSIDAEMKEEPKFEDSMDVELAAKSTEALGGVPVLESRKRARSPDEEEEETSKKQKVET